MSLSMQAKLLHILEEREFYPVDNNHKASVDVRIIAAFNRRLEKQMRDGTYRADFYALLCKHGLSPERFRVSRKQ